MMEKAGIKNVPLVKKVIVGTIGGIVLLVGILMIFLPGPAFLVIPAGLAILATEFGWAKRWLHKGRVAFDKARSSVKAKRRSADKA
jgi:tellurite resistance protein TerC